MHPYSIENLVKILVSIFWVSHLYSYLCISSLHSSIRPLPFCQNYSRKGPADLLSAGLILWTQLHSNRMHYEIMQLREVWLRRWPVSKTLKKVRDFSMKLCCQGRLGQRSGFCQGTQLGVGLWSWRRPVWLVWRGWWENRRRWWQLIGGARLCPRISALCI